MIYREPLYIMILKPSGEIQLKALEDTDEPTQEMLQEIEYAKKHGIPIRSMSDEKKPPAM